MDKKLTIDITIMLFKMLENEISLTEFEEWLYQTNKLEYFLDTDDYLKLISLDFKGLTKNNKHIHEIKKSIQKIIDKYADLSQYQTYQLKNLLFDFLHRRKEPASTLVKFYNLYCQGYDFLERLGVYYGLNFVCYFYELEEQSYRDFFPTSYTKADIENAIQEEVNKILPEVDKEVQKVLSWLQEGKIEIVNNLQSDRKIDYIDRRNLN